jgi:hypothetical protein
MKLSIKLTQDHVTPSGRLDFDAMNSFFPYILFGVFFLVFYKISGVPKLMEAYPDRAQGEFENVGVFSLGRDRVGIRGAIIRVSANRDGLLLRPLWPFWLRSAYIPWGDVWLRDATNPLRPNKQIGFLQCPSVSYFITSLFKAKVERTIKSQVPI